MAIEWYSCSECGKAVRTGDGSPYSNGCACASSHNWHRLGEVGNENYCCANCGLVIQTELSPFPNGCSKASSHNWCRLGVVGNESYSCSNCGAIVQTDGSPFPNGCPCGGSHNWNRL